MSTSPKIDFWFELSSPYSYLSALRIQDIAEKNNIEINWLPFLLGPFFKKQGWNTTPFNIQKEKGEYMWIDTKRRADKFGFPFIKPEIFPTNSVYPSRAILAAMRNSKDDGVQITLELFKLYFQEGKDIGHKEVLKSFLTENKRDDLWEAVNSQEIKDLLKKQTDHALELGIFGAPMFIYNDQKFWGDDRLEDLVESI